MPQRQKRQTVINPTLCPQYHNPVTDPDWPQESLPGCGPALEGGAAGKKPTENKRYGIF